MVGFEIAVRKASKYYTLADFARMGLFIHSNLPTKLGITIIQW